MSEEHQIVLEAALTLRTSINADTTGEEDCRFDKMNGLCDNIGDLTNGEICGADLHDILGAIFVAWIPFSGSKMFPVPVTDQYDEAYFDGIIADNTHHLYMWQAAFGGGRDTSMYDGQAGDLRKYLLDCIISKLEAIA